MQRNPSSTLPFAALVCAAALGSLVACSNTWQGAKQDAQSVGSKVGHSVGTGLEKAGEGMEKAGSAVKDATRPARPLDNTHTY